jgi:2-oxoglutarate ferredoxin oxidoreductase subunit gamma
MKMTKMQIRFTGVGGQGILLAGDILCDAAINEGKHSVKIGTYTSQVRGGPTMIDVLCDEEDIDYPYAIDGEIDFMLSVANSSYQIYKKGVRPGAIIVIDPNLVYPTPDDRKTWRIIEIPVVEIAKREIGNIATQSSIALGIAFHITRCVSANILMGSICHKVPKKSIEKNKEAFAAGIFYAEQKCK